MSYYAYILTEENKQGIVNDWEECKKLISNKKSRYKKFNSEDEANVWLNSGATYEKKKIDKSSLIKSAVYFDAGTGRGNGVEVKVSDYHSNSLLYFIMDTKHINEFGNYYVSKNRTNNFGELTGLFIALKYSIKYNVKDICGDSELVIKYWSNGQYNKENLDDDTISLIHKVNDLYLKFKNKGGKLHKISGDINPADLGFHK
ncbi:ribonuclease H family protein [Caviibacter abscessus]|uniref:ribonuclease H family protein n=1 Tax=Caviibacter abscessus TaxID=1766719 RepID=UPI00082BF5E4|nr:ribonuclease H family protein [Caviibacter abscessus]